MMDRRSGVIGGVCDQSCLCDPSRGATAQPRGSEKEIGLRAGCPSVERHVEKKEGRPVLLGYRGDMAARMGRFE